MKDVFKATSQESEFFREICIGCLVYACCTEACDKLIRNIFGDITQGYKLRESDHIYRKFLMSELKNG